MRKLYMILTICIVSLLVACGNENVDDGTKGYEIALITDVGTINDKSFNQGSWEGVVKYAKENDVTHKYYQPKEKTDKDYLDAIDLAVRGGAKVIVTPGYYFEKAIFEAQTKYPDVTFILIDGVPNNGEGQTLINDNVYSILFAEDQSGFLAGYAAVKNGFRNIGFMGGMAVPAVVRFGYGFLQGAEYAANEMGLANGAVKAKYTYLDSFGPSAEIQTQAASWYSSGTEVIFVAAGGAGSSVMASAESQTNKYVIGVDIDQSGDSQTVITSATKQLSNSVYLSLKAYYGDTTTGIESGNVSTLDITNDGVGLPTDFSRMPNQAFTQNDYNAIVEALKNDTNNIRTNIMNDTSKTTAQLGLSKVTVQ